MADDDDPKAGELVTANYGWTKPTVGASDDQWGGYLNADLDGIDSVVHGIDTRPAYVLPVASTTVLGGAKVDGTTIHAAADGTLSGTPSSGPPVTISAMAPASPQVGALWWDSVGGQLYTFYNDGNSSQWVIAVNAGAFLQPASTTVLGGVKVDGTTIKAAADGTISAPIFMGDNRIINGDMRIDQRNAGASKDTIGYTVDRWQYIGTQTSKIAWGQGANPGNQFPYFLKHTTEAAYTPLTGDTFYLVQPIEADMISDFNWGSSGAQPVTLSFWAMVGGGTPATGLFSGAIANYGNSGNGTRSYPFTFSLPTANVWTKFSIAIPGDTTGTWLMSGNGVGAYLRFDLGSGATYRAPAGAWAGGNFVGANGAVNLVATNTAALIITGVKLEIGSVATPFNRQSLAKSMADCQRYYQRLGGSGVAGNILVQGYGGPSGVVASSIGFPTMRAVPTINSVGVSGGFTASNCTMTYIASVNTLGIQAAAVAQGQVNFYNNADGAFTLDAEL